MIEPEPFMRVDDITLRFGGVTALDGVSFDVERGQLFAIIGPNGAGKSSLFNAISGLFRPTGSIRLGGTELTGKAPAAIARLGVARMFQNLGLFHSMDVLDNLLVGHHTRMRGGVLSGALWIGRTKNSEKLARQRCTEILELLDLGSWRHTMVATLPYGIRKRVELGKALAMNPEILLLDEPVAGMNHDETDDIAHQILTVQHETNLTMLLIEHDTHFVMDLADRVMVLDFGKVIANDLPDVVRNDPRVAEAYLGGGDGWESFLEPVSKGEVR